jgi:hypothetical protein
MHAKQVKNTIFSVENKETCLFEKSDKQTKMNFHKNIWINFWNLNRKIMYNLKPIELIGLKMHKNHANFLANKNGIRRKQQKNIKKKRILN